jgi:hypothetical protein
MNTSISEEPPVSILSPDDGRQQIPLKHRYQSTRLQGRKKQVPPKQWYPSIKLHIIIQEKTTVLILTAISTLNLIYLHIEHLGVFPDFASWLCVAHKSILLTPKISVNSLLFNPSA